MGIRERYEQIQEEIRNVAGDRPVTLVAVSKYVSVEAILEAYEAGIRDFGENRVQDALVKMEAIPDAIKQDLRWHLIGNLQTNKVNKTIGRFALLHAIDAPHLGEAVSKANAAKNIRQPVLIQVNSTSDPTRHGVLPEQAASLLLPLPGIEIRGLMTMAPADASIKGDRTELQRVFCGLRELRDQLATKFGMQLPELSMGMSHDYIHALECGATIIRIGNFLFKN
jgi:pyridoxal phosphate enzyme (YggS family)